MAGCRTERGSQRFSESAGSVREGVGVASEHAALDCRRSCNGWIGTQEGVRDGLTAWNGGPRAVPGPATGYARATGCRRRVRAELGVGGHAAGGGRGHGDGEAGGGDRGGRRPRVDGSNRDIGTSAGFGTPGGGNDHDHAGDETSTRANGASGTQTDRGGV